ncbi:hypothetical protein RIEGSTA812A_PEG_254 [invertebrate metagenome]|uniref:Uncharacterized protein n=1 Tax=invertebrate metagenome TaxID=1711999 RepID=A0A484H5Z5_9ZZZZ
MFTLQCCPFLGYGLPVGGMIRNRTAPARRESFDGHQSSLAARDPHGSSLKV